MSSVSPSTAVPPLPTDSEPRSALDPPETKAHSPCVVPTASDLPPDPASDVGPLTQLPVDFDGTDCRTTLGEVWRHSGWHRTRRRVLDALHDAHQTHTRTSRFAACGCDAWIARSPGPPVTYKVTSNCCRDRFCIPCAAHRARVIASNAAELVGSTRLRLITLTLRAENRPLVHTLSVLDESFARLRRTRLWQTKVFAGICFTEVKLGAGSGLWHPHVHVIAQGKYILHRALSDTWQAITGTSKIVHVAAIKGTAAVLSYCTKYAAKAFDAQIARNPHALCEMVQALRGRRLVTTFGRWRGTPLCREPETGEWQVVCSLEGFLERLRVRDPTAIAIAHHLPGTRMHAARTWYRDRAPPPSIDSPRSRTSEQLRLFDGYRFP